MRMGRARQRPAHSGRPYGGASPWIFRSVAAEFGTAGPLDGEQPPRRGPRCRNRPHPAVKIRRNGYSALPAFQAVHDMFQPLRPLSGAIVLSWEFFTTTRSPTCEWP
jgi:hypothetical protein